MNECIALVHDAIIYNSFFQLLLVTMLRTMPWPCNSCFCYLYSKLKLICCHCWGGQCAVKKVKRKDSRPSDSLASNAKTVISSSQPCTYDCHSLHQKSQGSPCSDESNKSEITFSARAGLATGILRQHSLAKLGEWFTFWSNNHQIIIK